jgi:hypothetical protein
MLKEEKGKGETSMTRLFLGRPTSSNEEAVDESRLCYDKRVLKMSAPCPTEQI